MSKRGDREFILDMLIACNRILEYAEGLNFEKFSKSSMVVDAIIRNIEILGEAAKKISENIKNKYPEIDWQKIGATRDKVIHSYFGIKLEIVWDIITTHVPKLKKQLEKIIKQEDWEVEGL